MSNQLLKEAESWETCRTSAALCLRLVEEELIHPSGQADAIFLEDLQEKFSGILKYEPADASNQTDEDVQYLRYHMILTLDSAKKLVDYYTHAMDS